MIEVKAPIQQFLDTDGSPLDAGYIYIGSSGANPETMPQAVYWDKDGLIPAAQPIRTLNGYPSRDGAVSRFFTSAANWSISVKNKNGELVYSTLDTDSGVFATLSASGGASNVGYNNASSGLAATNVQNAIDKLKADADSLASTVSGLESKISGVVNLFANSAFMINQRGYVSGTATSGTNQYTLDRIRVATSGESLTFTTSTFGNKITAPTGGAEQVIEGLMISGGEYACSWVGVGTIKINGTVRAKNEVFTLPPGVNATVTLYGEFEQFLFTRPTMVGKYEYDAASDLRMCQRYLPAFGGNSEQIGFGGSFDANSTRLQVRFPVTPRVPPTGVFVSSAAHFAIHSGSSGNIALTGISFSSSGKNGAFLTATHSGGSAANIAVFFISTNASANLYFTGCEL